MATGPQETHSSSCAHFQLRKAAPHPRANLRLTRENICSTVCASGTPADGAGLGSASLRPSCASPLPLARSADGAPAVLAPAPVSVDQGPGAFPCPNEACFAVDPADATPAQFDSFFECVPVFQLLTAGDEEAPRPLAGRHVAESASSEPRHN